MEKDQRPKVEPFRDLGEKQLYEVPEELLQDRLEELIMSHASLLLEVETKSGREDLLGNVLRVAT